MCISNHGKKELTYKAIRATIKAAILLARRDSGWGLPELEGRITFREQFLILEEFGQSPWSPVCGSLGEVRLHGGFMDPYRYQSRDSLRISSPSSPVQRCEARFLFDEYFRTWKFEYYFDELER